tara:strand:+ start:100 stop:450 length:351 start_codon:yes stop_codon:yes gene_type:complete
MNTTPPFTQERFESLPVLLPVAVMQAWTGLRSEVLAAMAKAGEIDRLEVAGMLPRYYKYDLAKLGGFQLSHTPSDRLRLTCINQHYQRLRTPLFTRETMDLDQLRQWTRELGEILG